MAENLPTTPSENNSNLQKDPSDSHKRDTKQEGLENRCQWPPSHCSYLYVSLANLETSSSPSTPGASAPPSPGRSHIRSGHRTRSVSISTPPTAHVTQSRPSSPPPATQFPPQRRPSVSLPPSPHPTRIHRSSLPAQPALGFRLPSPFVSGASSAPVSNSDLRPRTPSPPPISPRSPSRRSNRTPSPRPPLPPQPTMEASPPTPQPLPNRNRQESQPHKLKMRAR